MDNTEQKALRILDELQKELCEQFPPNHWNSFKVWSAYRNLQKELKKGLYKEE